MGKYLEGTNWHYGQQTQDYTLTRAELNHFLKLEIIMQNLMEAGIHNWPEYDAVMEKSNKEFKE